MVDWWTTIGEIITSVDRLAEPFDEPMDARGYLALMRRVPVAVAIVTTLDADGRPQGITVTSACSVSLDPPTLLVCVDLRSRTLPAIREHRAMAVHYLAPAGEELARRFASPLEDRFEGLACTPGLHGVPLLDGTACCARLECLLEGELVVSGHAVLIARVQRGAAPDMAAALTRHDGQYAQVTTPAIRAPGAPRRAACRPAR